MGRIELERVSPEKVGLSSDIIRAFIAELEQSGTEMHGLIIERYGKVAAECWWTPYSSDIPHCCFSMGKTYMAAAAGIAYDEGLLDLEERVIDIFQEEIKDRKLKFDENMQELTVHHILSMSTGMESVPPLYGDIIDNFISYPVKFKPGTRFFYNTAGSCLLGAILCKKTGESVKSYVSTRLFEPIGIDPERMKWLKFSNGVDAEPGVYTTTEDNLRLAMLYLNHGRWNGKQILSEDWIERSTTIQINSKEDQGITDCKFGYGYLLWMCSVPGLYRFDGAFGQYCIISPKDNMVISISEGANYPDNVQKTLDIVYRYFFQGIIAQELPENLLAFYQLKLFCKERTIFSQRMTMNMHKEYLRELVGSYTVTDGMVNIWLECYGLFYKREKTTSDKMEIKMDNDKFCMIFDDETEFDASLNGDYVYTKTESIVPLLDVTCSVIYMDAEGRLHFDINWMHTCLKTNLVLIKKGNKLLLDIRKPTLFQGEHSVNTYMAELTRT